MIEPCPYARDKENGAHSFVFILPENTERPATICCERCGSYAHVNLAPPVPLDARAADDILKASRIT